MGDKSIPNRDWSGTERTEKGNKKQKHPVGGFSEATAAETEKLGPGKLKQISFKKGGKV